MGNRYGILWDDYVALKNILSNVKLSNDEKLKCLIEKKAYINAYFKNDFDADSFMRFINGEIEKIETDIKIENSTKNNAMNGTPFSYEYFINIIHEIKLIPSEFLDAKLEFLKLGFVSSGFSLKTCIDAYEFFILEYEKAYNGFDNYFSQKKCRISRTDNYFFVNTPTINSYAGLKILLNNADTFFINHKKIIHKFRELYLNYPTVDETTTHNKNSDGEHKTTSTVPLQEYEPILFNLKKIYDLYNESSIMEARLFIENEYFPSMNWDSKKGYENLRGFLDKISIPFGSEMLSIKNKQKVLLIDDLTSKYPQYSNIINNGDYQSILNDIMRDYKLDIKFIETNFRLFHLSPNSDSFKLSIDIDDYYKKISDYLNIIKNKNDKSFNFRLIEKHYCNLTYVLNKLRCLFNKLSSENSTITYNNEFFNIFSDLMDRDSLAENMQFTHEDINTLIKLVNKKIKTIEIYSKNDQNFDIIVKTKFKENENIFLFSNEIKYHQEFRGIKKIPPQILDFFNKYCNFNLIINNKNLEIPIPKYYIDILKHITQKNKIFNGARLKFSAHNIPKDYFMFNEKVDEKLIIDSAIKPYWDEETNTDLHTHFILNNISQNLKTINEIKNYEDYRYFAWGYILKFPHNFLEFFPESNNFDNIENKINLSKIQVNNLFSKMNNVYFQANINDFKLLCKNKPVKSKIKWIDKKNSKNGLVNITTLRAFCSFLLNIKDYSFPPKYFVNDNFSIENKNQITFFKVKKQDTPAYDRHIVKFKNMLNNP